MVLVASNRYFSSFLHNNSSQKGIKKLFSTSNFSDLWASWDFGKSPTDDLSRFNQFLKNQVQSSDNDPSSYSSTMNSVKPSIPAQFDEHWNFLSDQEVQQGVSLLSSKCTSDRLMKLNSVVANRTNRVRMLFENPANVNNVWAALRTFDSFGIQNIDIVMEHFSSAVSNRFPQEDLNSILPQDLSAFPDRQIKKKSTMYNAMGSQKWLTVSQHRSTSECLTTLKESGYKILASDLHQSSLSFAQLDWSTIGKCVIVMGNEDTGISDTVRSLADQRFYLPMKGFAESFNLSVACAIICSVLEFNQVLTPNLTKELQNRLLLTWLSRTVPGALHWLKRDGLNIQQTKHLYNTILGFSTKP